MQSTSLATSLGPYRGNRQRWMALRNTSDHAASLAGPPSCGCDLSGTKTRFRARTSASCSMDKFAAHRLPDDRKIQREIIVAAIGAIQPDAQASAFFIRRTAAITLRLGKT